MTVMMMMFMIMIMAIIIMMMMIMMIVVIIIMMIMIMMMGVIMTVVVVVVVVKMMMMIIIIIPCEHAINSLQKNSCTWNIIHKNGSATIWNLKPDSWSQLIFQEDNYQKKEPEIRRESIVIIIELICSSVLGTTYGLTPGLHSGSPVTRTWAG